MRKLQTNIDVEFIIRRCSECDIVYALTETFWDRRQQDGSAWQCPNGHGQVVRESEVARLERELEEMRREKVLADLQRASALRERDQEQDRRREREKELRAMKCRTGNGVCPCCHRSFQQLKRHMENKHPEFVKETKSV